MTSNCSLYVTKEYDSPNVRDKKSSKNLGTEVYYYANVNVTFSCFSHLLCGYRNFLPLPPKPQLIALSKKTNYDNEMR